jgi:hypothetical protein
MIAPDDGTLRTLAAGHVPHDGRGLCAALAAEVLRLREAIAVQASAARMLGTTRDTLAARDRRTLDSLDAQDRADLLAEMDAIRAERDAFNAAATELQDILTPRSTPPTAAEMAAHGAAGGVWLTAWPWRSGVWADDVVPALRARDAVEPGMTWLPLDAQRRPCAWPTPARIPGCETVGPCDDPERPR